MDQKIKLIAQKEDPKTSAQINHLSRNLWISTAFLSTAVALTIIGIIQYHDSPFFIKFLIIIFFFSLIKAGFNAFPARKTKKRSARSDKTIENTSESDVTSEHTPSNDNILSVNEYLALVDFRLNHEILSSIEWKRFEFLCYKLLCAMGHVAERTGDGADNGVDIRVYDGTEKEITTHLIQCKHWRGKQKIKREYLQQLRGQMATERVDKGGFFSTANFTSPAKEYAATNNIELFDRVSLMDRFNNLDQEVRKTILGSLLVGNYWTPSCATCGEKMKAVNKRGGGVIWMCRNSRKHGWSSISYYEALPIEKLR